MLYSLLRVITVIPFLPEAFLHQDPDDYEGGSGYRHYKSGFNVAKSENEIQSHDEQDDADDDSSDVRVLLAKVALRSCAHDVTSFDTIQSFLLFLTANKPKHARRTAEDAHITILIGVMIPTNNSIPAVINKTIPAYLISLTI